MPRLPSSRRRKGAGCGYHGWSCRLGGDSSYVSSFCCPVPIGVDLDDPPTDLTETDPKLDELLLKASAFVKGMTLDELRAERARQDADAQAHARRRARMSPAELCADTDAFWTERLPALIATSRARLRERQDRKLAETAAAAAEPVDPEQPEPATARRAVQRRPLRVAGGVFDDDDDDPRVVMYAR